MKKRYIEKITPARQMLKTAASKREHEAPFPLPVVYVAAPPYTWLIKHYAARCVALSKKAAIAALQGKEINVDYEIETMMLHIRELGYSNGLSDMDKMHKLVNDGK